MLQRTNERLFQLLGCRGITPPIPRVESRQMSDSDRYLLEQIVSQQKAENAPRLSDDKYFEIFSAEQILKLRGFDLDPDQTRSGVIGSGGDGGVDSIFLFANRRLVREDAVLAAFKDQQVNLELLIIQSKYKNSFSETVIQKLQDFTEKCLPLTADKKETQQLYNQAARDAVQRFHDLYKLVLSQRPKLSISYYYVSLGEQIDPKVTVRRDGLERKCREFFSAATVTFDFVGAAPLLGLFNKAPTKTLQLQTSKSIPWSSFGTAYICLVPLYSFYEFITENDNLRGHIFEANVRDYHSDATVNKEISATLSVTGNEEFWWLNNGITIIASKAISSGDIFSVTDPLIVNGLQTSHEIYYHFLTWKSINADAPVDDKRNVMVRLIENNDPQSMDHIIKATNNQTKIPRMWLHATEDIHRKIEIALKSADLYYDRRKNYYRNHGKPAAKIVTLPYLSQALAAIILQRPDDARARPTMVAEAHYKHLYSEQFPIEMYVRCAQLLKRVDDYLDSFDVVEVKVKNNVMFHAAMYLACVICKSPHPQRARISTIDMSVVTDELLFECVDAVGTKYNKLGGNDQVAKGPKLVEQNKEGARRKIWPLNC
jgi:hypothetical protein